MHHHQHRPFLLLSAAGALGLALLAGCGGATGSSGTPSPAPNAATSSAPATVAHTTALSISDTGVGMIVTDQSHMTLYVFTGDHAGQAPMSTCTGACAAQWPPAIVDSANIPVSGGIDAKALGTITRPDGGTQLTLGGAPLYRYAGDSKPGDANGQGVDGTWFAATPEGRPAGHTESSPSSPSASPTTNGGYGKGY